MVNQGIKTILKQSVLVFTTLTLLFPPIIILMTRLAEMILPMFNTASPYFPLFVSFITLRDNIIYIIQGQALLSVQAATLFLFVRVTNLRNDDSGIITYENEETW